MATRPPSWSQPATTGDPFIDELRRRKEERVAATVVSSQSSPAEAAKANRLARQYEGIPAEAVERNIAAFEAKERARAMAEIVKANPYIGAYMAQNPRMTIAMQNDTKSLEGLAWVQSKLSNLGGSIKAGWYRGGGSSWNAIGIANDALASLKTPGRMVTRGLEAGVATIGNMTGLYNYDPSKDWKRQDQIEARRRGAILAQRKELADRFRIAADMARGVRDPEMGWFEEGVYAAGESLAPSLTAMAATVATRNPYTGAAQMGLGVGLERYSEGRARGEDAATAARRGIVQGLPEAAFEIAPGSVLLENVAKHIPFARAAGRLIATEVPSEIGTETVQSFGDYVADPNMTYNQWLASLPRRYVVTAIAAIGGGVGQASLTSSVEQGFKAVAWAGRRLDQAKLAAEGKSAIDAAFKSAENSEFRKNDPEGYTAFMQHLADSSGVDSVFVPGEAIRQFMQSDNYDADNDPLAPFQVEIAEALATGGDVALPAAFAMSVLPGTKAGEALKDDMRFLPGGESAREALQSVQQIESILTKMGERADSQGKAQAKEQAARQALEDHLTKMIATSKPADLARVEAAQAASFFTVMADMAGVNIEGMDPAEIIRRVTGKDLLIRTVGENVNRDQPADTIEAVIQTLRGLPREAQGEAVDAIAAAADGEVAEVTDAIASEMETMGNDAATAAAEELDQMLKVAGLDVEAMSDDEIAGFIDTLDSALKTSERAFDDRLERTGDRGTGDQGGSPAPLEGAPAIDGATGPDPALLEVAESYAQKAGLTLRRQAEYVEISPEFSKRLADAYAEMEHAPSDPAVAEAYADMLRQTRAQYDALVEAGYKFTFFDAASDPYEGNPWNAMRDLRANKRMAVYGTYDGYGTEGITQGAVEGNPMLADTGLRWLDQAGVERAVTGNDLFRAVHDAFGHGLEGAGFRARGEENAWQAHSRLFTGPGLAALTSETRGQNSWLNFGPYGETNQTAKIEETVFADQKTGLMPEWTWTEGRAGDMAASDGRDQRLYQQALLDGERARATTEGVEIGWTGERIGQLLRTHAYNPDFTGNPEDATRSKAVAVRLSPDDFLGLTASEGGRRLIAERVEGEDYGGEIDFDRMRSEVQAPFLIVTNEGGFTANLPDGKKHEVPRRLRVVGHEGRHRMTMLKKAGVTSIPVVVIFQDAKASRDVESMEAGPQRSRSDQVSTGDTSAMFSNMVPISYANRDRLVEEFGSGRELFQSPLREFLQTAGLPEFIEIDGVERHTRNSEGRALAANEEGVRNFWRWFGDSKVVDEEGRPLVVYHGTNQTIEAFDAGRLGDATGAGHGASSAFFFTSNEEEARDYAEHASSRIVSNVAEFEANRERLKAEAERLEVAARRSGDWGAYERVMQDWENLELTAIREPVGVEANVVAVYLRIERPAERTFDGGIGSVGEFGEFVEKARSDGADGIIARNISDSPKGGFRSDHFASFSPTQIKSINNRGTFSASDPRILYQREFEQRALMAGTFYSGLERAVESIKADKAPASQWIATIKNAPGVKAEELEWTGIVEWLDAQDGIVTKADLLAMIEQGGIEVEERVLGEVDEQEVQSRIDEMVYDANDEFYDYWEPPFYVHELDEEELDELEWEEGEERGPRWIMREEGYSIWHHETIYESEDEAHEAAVEANLEEQDAAYEEWERDYRRNNIDEDEIRQSLGGVKWGDWSIVKENQREILITLPRWRRGNPDIREGDRHWSGASDEPVIAHARVADTIVDGQKWLFVNEVQATIHQEARELVANAKEQFFRKWEGYALALADDFSIAFKQEILDAATNEKTAAFYPKLVKFLTEEGAKRDGDASAFYMDQIKSGIAEIEALGRGYEQRPDPAKVAAAAEAWEEAGRVSNQKRVIAAQANIALHQALLPYAEEVIELNVAPALAKWKEGELARMALMNPDVRARKEEAFPNLEQAQREVLADAIGSSTNFSTLTRVDPGGVRFAGLDDAARALARTFDAIGREVPADLVDLLNKAKQADDAHYDARQMRSLREAELRVAEGKDGVPDAPFKDTYPELVMKRLIVWAAEGGYEGIAWIKQGENNGGKTNDNVGWFYEKNLVNITNKLIKKHGGKVEGVLVPDLAPMPNARLDEIQAEMKNLEADSKGLVRTIGGIDSFRQKWSEIRDMLQADRTVHTEDYARAERITAQLEALSGDEEVEVEGVPYLLSRRNAWHWRERRDEAGRLLNFDIDALEKTADFEVLWAMVERYRVLGKEYGELERTTPTNFGFRLTPELKEVALTAGFPLFQKEREARGRIIFEPERVVIELLQARNLSTFTHELGHLMAEIIQRLAMQPGAPPRAVQIWRDMQAWWQENGFAVGDGDLIAEAAHELLADTYLAYVQEGKAPSLSLQRVFETISSWLRQIYKGIRKLNMPITPEIRSVFDRLLATDEELFQAREAQGLSLMFDEAAQAALGISKSEMAAYQTMIGDARSEARAKLIDKTMASVRASATKSYRAERARVRAEIEGIVDTQPVIRALRNLETMPIPADWFEERYGAEALDKMPRRVPPIIRASAADPEIVAEMSGFPGADAMVKALMAAKVEQDAARAGGDQRGMRERLIETATDAEMNERYGDPLNDGSIEREALAAVHNDMQGEVIATELRVLGRNLNRRPTPYRLAREWARGRIRSSEVREHLTGSAIQRYVRAAAKAGNAAEDALAKQDWAEAFRQKQFQLLNNALVAEAREARDEVERAVKRLRRIADARTLKTVDQDYLEQAHALLEQVDLKQRTAKSVERFGKWEEWARAREAEGYDIVAPHSFEAMIGKTNWTKLPVTDLLALADTIKQIEHLGRLKRTLRDNRDQREFEAVIAEAVTSAGEAGNIPPKGTFTDPSWWDSIKHRVASMDAALLKLEAVFDWLDNGNPNGVFNRYVFRPIARAQAREDDMLRDYYGRIKDAFEAVGAKTLRRWSEKVTTDLIDRETGMPAVFTRQRLVAMALNVGNEGNMQRLVDGYGWNEGAVMRLLDKELTKQEWQFVQQVWDTIDTLWPEIERMERAINGVAPDKIEAREIVTSHGTFRGGYYPAVYDSTLSLKAEEQQGQRTDLFEALYTRATTRASATKERSDKVKRPLLLDLGVINRHLGEVIHDITHREAVMQAHRFLTNEKVADAVNRSLGQEIRGQFRPWLQYVANSWAMERSGNEGIGRFMGAMRANTTVVGMGFRFTTILTQIAGYANSFEYVGTKWVTEAIARTSAHPIATFNFVMERSDEVRNRMNTLDRDIRLTINQMAGNAGSVTAAKRFAFHGIGYMDRMVVIPTWLGAYNKALESGASEEDAAYAGDKAVRLSQGAGSPKDLAAVQRGTGKWGEALKLLTMFYSYMSAYYQRQRTFGRDVSRASAADVPSLVARAWWLFVVAPLLPDLLKSLVGGGDLPDEEEEEGWGLWAFRKMLGNVLGPIPVVRDLYQPVWAKLSGERAFDYQFTPLQSAFGSIVNVAGDIGRIADGKETKKATKHAIETVGYFTGLVPGQVASSVQFLVDVGYGDAEPEGFGDWVEGIVTGRIKEDQ